jgi:hypothetical protein
VRNCAQNLDIPHQGCWKKCAIAHKIWTSPIKAPGKSAQLRTKFGHPPSRLLEKVRNCGLILDIPHQGSWKKSAIAHKIWTSLIKALEKVRQWRTKFEKLTHSPFPIPHSPFSMLKFAR